MSYFPQIGDIRVSPEFGRVQLNGYLGDCVQCWLMDSETGGSVLIYQDKWFALPFWDGVDHLPEGIADRGGARE